MSDVRRQLRSIRDEAVEFFAHTSVIAVSSSDLWQSQSLTPEDRDLRVAIRERLGRAVAKVATMFQRSPALGDEALRTVRREVRRLDSALRFKDFQSWEASTQYVEDYAIGTTPAGEFENLVSISTAQSIFEDAIDKILGLLNFAAIPNPAEGSADLEQDGPMNIGRQSAVVIDEPRSESAETRAPSEEEAANVSSTGDGVGRVTADRQSLLAAFKTTARGQGIRVTDDMVAKAANPGRWNDRTMVTWWKRNDDRCKTPHDKKIRALLVKEPGSIWSPSIKPKRPPK
jgi:hypothetical protein